MCHLRAYCRLLFFSVAITFGVCLLLASALLRGDVRQRNMKLRRWWVGWVLPVLGVKMDKRGYADRGPCIYVSNHRSFIDPVVTLKYVFALPLAKAEISKYPMIGFATKMTGILFVDRGSLKSRKSARDDLARTLRRGDNVLIYSEGTTNTGVRTMPFKRGTFDVAIDQGITVIPIAIEYRDPGDHWSDASMFEHFLYQFGKARSCCTIAFGPPMRADNTMELLHNTQNWINERLVEVRREYDEGNGK